MWFWDWKTCKVFGYGPRRPADAAIRTPPLTPGASSRGCLRPHSKFKAHDKVIIDCQWHPHESSKVATASWDGTIKYWD